MNKRIIELAVQAGAYWNYPDYNMKGNVEFQEGELEKFAELIIQECADVCVKFGESGDGYTCSSEILEYFGVE